MRLNLFISKSGYCSRRKADSFIGNGEVEVNGKVVKEPFYQVKEEDSVKVKGGKIDVKERFYIIFNKPKGVTTTLNDRFAAKKVIDFFPKYFKGVYPVGRLDKDSSGLLLLTNDGDFCYKVTHPKFMVEKEYLVKVEGVLSAEYCRRAREGVISDGDLLRVKSIFILSRGREETLCKVIVGEGKKRHLRRLFKRLGFKVRELKRVSIGNLKLGNLAEGEYEITDKEEIYSRIGNFTVEKRIKNVRIGN